MDAMELADTIEYQEGSVVSKEILKTEGATVTLFAFGKGQGLSEHKTSYEALAYIIDGQAQVTVGGKEHQLASGQMIRMPADVPHALRAEDRFKMLLIMAKP